MSPELTLALIVAVPVIVLMVLRINAALVFLSLCLGAVLIQFVGSDSGSLASVFNSHAPKGVDTGGNNLKILLLLLPAVLTAIFMIRTVSGYSRLAMNLLPAIGVGLLGALLVVPLLPTGLSHDIIASNLWEQAQKLQDIIVGSSAVVCLFVLWLQRPHAGTAHKHGKHKA